MDRRSFLKLSGQISAAMLLAREAAGGVAKANNLPQPKVDPQAQAQPIPAPEPAAAPAPPPPQPAAPPSDERPFSEQWLKDLASEMSRQPFVAAKVELPNELRNLDYDKYRSINFNPLKSVWAQKGYDFSLQMFHAGYIYNDRVDISLVEDGIARPLRYSPSMFHFRSNVPPPPPNSNAGFSGFRVHSTINRTDYQDEFAVFQGASYFRAMAAGQEYGLSARGLAINTGQPPTEEFPIFRNFWIEKPKPNEDVINVYALLDSVSVTGAYKFAISNRNATLMDVDCMLYPRQPMAYVGIAPLTSMFRSGPTDATYYDDYRPRVYDSEGLQIWNGAGEHIWRPLINPARLQFSVFVDDSPKGFGLSMRGRNFRDFQDLEARYDIRPSLWIEPLDKWGQGAIDLIELPSPTEYNDNIVAFWRPKEGLLPGKSYRYRYRMHWCWEPPIRRNFAYVAYTKIAAASKPGWHACHLDFVGTENFQLCNSYDELCLSKAQNLQLTASDGAIGDVYFAPNKAIGGHRLSFDFRTRGVEQSDLRCVLIADGRPVSEVWTYRWTA